MTLNQNREDGIFTDLIFLFCKHINMPWTTVIPSLQIILRKATYKIWIHCLHY